MYLIYEIKCEGSCPNLPNFYIGSCLRDPTTRFQEHCNGRGARFTQKYKPISFKILKTMYCTKHQLFVEEHKITLDYISRYGFRRVRGGNFVNMRHDCHTMTKLKWLLHPLKTKLLMGRLGCPDPA